MISQLKALLFSVVDKLDSFNDPFDEYNRPAHPKYPETLAQKADQFEQDLVANFLILQGGVVNYRIVQDNRLPPDLGDQALWHGHAVAMQALKSSVTKSDIDRGRLIQWMIGQNEHFMAYAEGGKSGFRLIRGRWDDETIADNPSNDTATGILVGQAFALLFGPKDVPAIARDPLRKLADELLDNSYALIGPDLKPTQFGALIQGWKTDPLRASLCIAVMATAWRAFNDNRYRDAYYTLLSAYGDLLRYAKMRLWWLDNANDSHRAAAHLAVIAATTGNYQAREGLTRLWQLTHKSGNAWVYYLCKWGGGFGLSIAHTQQVYKTLSEFTLEDKQFDLLRDDTVNPPYGRVLWNGDWMSPTPMPVWMRSADDFVWQRNQFKLKGGSTPPASRYSGLDYLLAYWFGRELGCIGAND